MKRAPALVLAFLASMCASCASVPPPSSSRPVPRLDQLSLDEKIGQLFVFNGRGVFMNESSWSYQQLLHQVRDNHVGGIIWGMSNVDETASATRHLQSESRVPLLISADLEAGIGMRFLDTTFWPSAMAVAATGDPSLAEAEGRITAREARMIGVNHILAPVADVNIDPDNPVINTRSFGEDPHEVAKYVTAFIRGVQSEHVLACAKHFPGHGDTHVDSHRALPLLDVSRERLDRVELVPFRAAIQEGVGSVMMGHLAVPALDPTPAPTRLVPPTEIHYGTRPGEAPENATMPATISRPMIEGVLRHELGFRGMVVTDAFDMGGVSEHFDAGEAAVRAIEAGEDQILMSPNTDAAVAAVKAAVKSGRLTEARIDDSVRRILAAKSSVSMGVASEDELFRNLDAKEARDTALAIARRAVTRVREESGVLPLKKTTKLLLVVVSDFPETSNPLPELVLELRRHGIVPQVFVIDSRTREDELPPIVAAAAKNDAVLMAFAVRARSGAGEIAVPATARTLVPQIAKPLIAASFGTPYLLREVPSVKTYLCAYGVQPVMQTAVIEALFGDIAMTGKLPVTVR